MASLNLFPSPTNEEAWPPSHLYMNKEKNEVFSTTAGANLGEKGAFKR